MKSTDFERFSLRVNIDSKFLNDKVRLGVSSLISKTGQNAIPTDRNGPGGAIAVYTKKGQDLMNSLISTGEVVSYNGYTIIKEFYAPDYSVVKPTKTQTDNRVTLDWRPNILVNNVNPKIPLTFYNNDRTKNFKIVVEGMMLDGKMLMIEKIISRKAF